MCLDGKRSVQVLAGVSMVRFESEGLLEFADGLVHLVLVEEGGVSSG